MKLDYVAVLGFWLAALSTVEATPVPARDVSNLAARADVIVLGRIVSTQAVGTESISLPEGAVGDNIPSSIMVAELSIQEVLKGAPNAPSISVHYSLPSSMVGYATPPVATTCIFFLSQKGQEYSFTSPYYPAVPGALSPEPAGDTVIDRVTSRIAAVVDSAATSSADKAQALHALGDIPGEKSTQTFQTASHRAEPDVWPIAVSMLLKRGDISGLPAAVDFLLHSSSGRPTETENLRIGISIGVKDPGAVPSLATLLKHGDAAARRAAATALGRTASASAINSLAEALNDSDSQVRYYAVVGLAGITGQGGHRPNGNALNFRDREAEYLDYWRDWAKRR